MVGYARIPQGKVGRFTKANEEIGGLCVSPVSGSAVVVIRGKRTGADALSLIHYSKYTPTSILHMERNFYDKDVPMSVHVYSNHLESNQTLIEVLHVRLQETGIEHELKEFPEDQKGLFATFDAIETFNADDDSVQVLSHDQNNDMEKFYLANEHLRMIEGLAKVGELTADGRITHAPGDAKYITYNKDVYRHPTELGEKLSRCLDCEKVIYDDEFVKLGGDDISICPFGKELLAECPPGKRTSKTALADQFNRVLSSSMRTRSPRALPTAGHPYFGDHLIETADILVERSIVEIKE